MAKGEAKYATRTEGAVKEALLALLAKKQLADITVSELSREAHVSRSTFYEHFGNPAD
ncbi:MAG: TetR family transcriptional regulator, partial [Eggerthellaceae bacterium]|nr:TetR family transcriptional regulator [Eggerthellaceae bacterium]